MSRVSSPYLIIRDIFSYNRSCPNYRIVSYPAWLGNDSTCADKNIVTDDNIPELPFNTFGQSVKIVRQDRDSLGNMYVIPNKDSFGRDRIKSYIFPYKMTSSGYINTSKAGKKSPVAPTHGQAH